VQRPFLFLEVAMEVIVNVVAFVAIALWLLYLAYKVGYFVAKESRIEELFDLEEDEWK
jgi:hypothetical protein